MQKRKDELSIRFAVEDDAEILHKWWNDGKVMAHAGFPNGFGITIEKIKRKIRKNTDENRRFILTLESKPIGEMKYTTVDNSTAEIGIKICEFQYQNKGFGTEYVTKLINYLFFEMNYAIIILDTNVKNKRAQHVYEKLGFQKIRTRKNAGKNQIGEMQSYYDYVLQKKDWAGLTDNVTLVKKSPA